MGLRTTVMQAPGQANIRSVTVQLPKQASTRLTTLQQACLAATFAANPSACPAGSNVGTATAATRVLAGPRIVSDLTGVPDMFARIKPTLASNGASARAPRPGRRLRAAP